MLANLSRFAKVLILLAAVKQSAVAAAVHGTVINKTSGSAVSGAEVLMNLFEHNSRSELRTLSDAEGRFRFDTTITLGTHGMLSVPYGGAMYKQVATSSGEALEIDVYDAASRLDKIDQTVDDLVIQAKENTIQVTEIFMVKNESIPPRTLVSRTPFEFYLPPGARVAMAAVASPGQLPVESTPIPLDGDGKFGFNVPLMPGLTQFEAIYELPYNGQIEISPRLTHRVNHLGVMVPLSMKFSAAVPSVYTQQSQQQGGMRVQLATQAYPGADLRFRISGSESAARSPQNPDEQPRAATQASSTQTHAAIQYSRSDWLGFAVICAAFLLVWSLNAVRRGPAASAPAATLQLQRDAAQDAFEEREAFKEKLFSLEKQWLQGAISRQTYEAARADLEPSLQAIGTGGEARSGNATRHS